MPLFGRKKKKESDLDILDEILSEAEEEEEKTQEKKIEEKESKELAIQTEKAPMPQEESELSSREGGIVPPPGYKFATLDDVYKIVESIIDEKMSNIEDLLKEYNKALQSISERLLHLEGKVKTLEERMNKIDAIKDEELNELKKVVEENIATMRAVEKVIRDLIPRLVEGIRKIEEMSNG